MQKIGILLPRSTYYAAIGFDLFEGLKAGLHHLERNDIKLYSDNIGFGTDQQQCYRIAEQFLMQKDISVVLAYVSHKIAQLLKPLFIASNKLLIVLDSGANMPQEWPTSSNTLYHSFHNSLGNWFCAEEARNQGYQKAALVTGYYDGGYLHIHAGYKGFLQNGGEIVFNHATGYTRDNFCLSDLKKWYSQESNVCFLSSFSGDYVQWYFSELEKHFITETPSIFLPPFALEESMLMDTPFPNHKIKGIAAWYRGINTEENRCFIHSMEEKGKQANLFSLLGWESAFLSAKAIDLMNDNQQNGKYVCKEMIDFSFMSPRGNVFFHSSTNTTLAPLFSCDIQKNNISGNCELKVDKKLTKELILKTYEEMTAIPLENAISGWYNSYTCI